MLLTILWCTDPTTENHPAQNGSSAKVEKPFCTFMYLFSGPLIFHSELYQGLSSGI